MNFALPLRASAFVLASAAAFVAACSAASENPGALGGSGGGGSFPSFGGAMGSGGTTGSGGLLPETGGGNLGSFTSSGGGGQGGQGGGCTGVSQQAEKTLGGKADIIWVIDNSGSMFDEALGVQNNMNAFSDFITKTGIDVHVVVVSAGPPIGVCIAPPLGSGQPCPMDSNPPVYTHILQPVGSYDALFQLMNTYPQWQNAIRPDSTKTIVVVSDDNAQIVPSPDEFKQFFDNAWQGSKWRFSGAFCKVAVPLRCFGVGTVYDGLVQQTGGVFSELSDPAMDWTTVFKQLGDAIVADAKPVDCEWKIPPPPQGKTFNKNEVNVDFTPGAGAKETFVKVTEQTCPASGDGWFYDSEETPTTVRVCAQSCTKIQADKDAKIDITFGCESKRPIM